MFKSVWTAIAGKCLLFEINQLYCRNDYIIKVNVTDELVNAISQTSVSYGLVLDII